MSSGLFLSDECKFNHLVGYIANRTYVCLSLLHSRAHTVGMNYIDGKLFVMGRTPARDPTVFDLSLGCEVLHLSSIIVTF